MSENQELKQAFDERCDDLKENICSLKGDVHALDKNVAVINEQISSIIPSKEIIEKLTRHDTVLKIHNWLITLIVWAIITGAFFVIRGDLL